MKASPPLREVKLAFTSVKESFASVSKYSSLKLRFGDWSSIPASTDVSCPSDGNVAGFRCHLSPWMHDGDVLRTCPARVKFGSSSSDTRHDKWLYQRRRHRFDDRPGAPFRVVWGAERKLSFILTAPAPALKAATERFFNLLTYLLLSHWSRKTQK